MGDGLDQIVNNYSATLYNGILTISDATNVPGLISAIAIAAAEAGELLPD